MTTPLSNGLVGAMDSFARGLKCAVELINQGVMAQCVKVNETHSAQFQSLYRNAIRRMIQELGQRLRAARQHLRN